ncbi:MAG TPA: LCP family protein [Humibacter sp.]|nr:LCP family protein [Humibacter sp.]
MNELRPRRKGGPSSIARHGRLRPGSAWSTVGKIIASVAAVAVISAVSLGAYATFDLVKTSHKSVHLIGEPAQQIPDIAALKGGVNILITATDTRSGQGSAYGPLDDSSGAGNNDVTMLMHLSQDHTHATVVAFPRDLMVPIPSCPTLGGGSTYAQTKAQINTTYSLGGLPCTVLTIQQLTGVKSIPFAGVITFSGVVAMSNAIGGVPVCIGGKGIHDPDTSLNLDPGMRMLQGKTATEFLRTRHGVGDGSDLGRISNQMVFLSSLVRTIKSAGTLTNPVKVWGLAKAATSNMRLSDQLDNVTTLYQIAMALKNLSLDNVAFLQYPVATDPDDPNRVVPDEASATVLFDAIKKDQPIAITGGTGGGDQGSIVKTPTPTSTPTPTGSKTSTPNATGTPGGPVQLPNSIHGQTAATETCSNGAG